MNVRVLGICRGIRNSSGSSAQRSRTTTASIVSVHEKVREGRLVDDSSLDIALPAVKRLADAIRARSPVPA
jgi:hypothetical protein